MVDSRYPLLVATTGQQILLQLWQFLCRHMMCIRNSYFKHKACCVRRKILTLLRLIKYEPCGARRSTAYGLLSQGMKNRSEFLIFFYLMH